MKHLICNKTKELLRFMVYILLPLTGGGWVGVSCSDYDDYNTVPGVFGGDQTGANNTLWENISNDLVCLVVTRLEPTTRCGRISPTISS